MVNVGVIGTGGISGTHLRYLCTVPDVRIRALCDINEHNLSRRQKEFGGNPYSSLEEMLRREPLDAVYLCTPPEVRREPLLACAAAGIPVLCEKPVERDPARAHAIDAELRKLDARVQIGYALRTFSHVVELRRLLADDRVHVGQLLYACNMSLGHDLSSWFFDKERSGGALVDQATHTFDLLRSLFGEVEMIRGAAHNPVHPKKDGYTIDEAISLTLLFRSGLMVSHLHSWVSDDWRYSLVLSGEKRLYRFDNFEQTLSIQSKGEVRTIHESRDHHDFQSETFLDCVRRNDWSANPCDYAEGIKTLELTLAADRAAVTGDTIYPGRS